jgi:hypothetical protein
MTQTPFDRDAAKRAPFFKPIALPVNANDAEQFPEIAAAIEHARKQRMGA